MTNRFIQTAVLAIVTATSSVLAQQPAADQDVRQLKAAIDDQKKATVDAQLEARRAADVAEMEARQAADIAAIQARIAQVPAAGGAGGGGFGGGTVLRGAGGGGQFTAATPVQVRVTSVPQAM